MGRGLANVYRLGLKELRSLRADPVLVLLILYTFTFAVYSVTTGVKFEVRHAAVAVVDEDRSALSRRIADALLEPLFKPAMEISAPEIDAAMDRGRFIFVLEIPPRFEADVLAGRRPTLQVGVDATAMAQAGNGGGYIQSILSREVAGYLQGTDGVSTPPINFVLRANFNPNLTVEWFNAVMQVINNVTMLSVILTGAALIREREHGTVEHLLVMPVSASEIMLAKIWANGLVIVLAAALSLQVVVQQLLGIPLAGSLLLFAGGAVIYQFSVTALGILLATFTSSMPQFGLLALPILIMMNLLSGSSTPLESMPTWLQNVMLLAPSTHFVSFSQGVLYRGADLAVLWPALAAMSGIGALFFTVALLRFRRAVAAMS